MTNREQWEHKIRQLSDADFAALLCGSQLSDGCEMQIRFGEKFCAWCEAIHGGSCQNVEASECPVTEEDYLRAEVIA